ncbi:MAG: hypothetical protein ACI4KN_01935, partial [Gemmiger sp.]
KPLTEAPRHGIVFKVKKAAFGILPPFTLRVKNPGSYRVLAHLLCAGFRVRRLLSGRPLFQ